MMLDNLLVILIDSGTSNSGTYVEVERRQFDGKAVDTCQQTNAG